MNQRITLSLLLLTSFLALPAMGASDVMETQLNASDFEGKSALYFSRPTTIEVIETEQGLFPADHEGILQIGMELVGFDPVGHRESYIRFTKKMITEYVMAIENFLSMARNASSSTHGRDGMQIASLLSCDTLKGPMYLSFRYHQPRGSVAYLSIGTDYDPESKAGIHYFTPADAQELVSILIKFAHAPVSETTEYDLEEVEDQSSTQEVTQDEYETESEDQYEYLNRE